MPQLILCTDLDSVGQDARRLAREAAAGRLVRIRRGAYAARTQWDVLTTREKYGAKATACNRTRDAAPVFALSTAAVMWGLWLVGTPRDLNLRTQFSGGGRSRPGVRSHLLPLDDQPVALGEFLVMPKANTAVELAVRLPFAQAVAVVDSCRRPPGKDSENRDLDPALGPRWAEESLLGAPATVDELHSLAERLPSAAKIRRALRVIEFSSDLAESAGESISRANMHILGFPAPELQHKFDLPDGTWARTDFHWAEHGLVGEFDGKGKYMRADWGGGLTPAERVMKEKDREDAIRALGLGFVRWDWKAMMNLPTLAGKLGRAGLPQATRRRRTSKE